MEEKVSAELIRRLAVHLHPEMAALSERRLLQPNLEILIAGIIFDRNLQLGFHKPMTPMRLKKSPVHRGVHSRSHNQS